MGVFKGYMYHNSGTKKKPFWNKILPKTIANLVLVDEGDETSNIRDEVKVTWEEGATANVGGVSKGEKYNDTSVKDIVYDITHPYIPPKISNITFDTDLVNESGITVDIKNLGFTVEKGSADIRSIKFTSELHESTITQSLINTLNNDGLLVFANTTDIPIKKSSKIKKVNVIVTDTTSNTVTESSEELVFVYPLYYGVINDNTSITENIIKGYTKAFTCDDNYTCNYTTSNQRPVFASPVNGYGVTKIIDQNGLDVTNVFNVSTMNITGTDGTTQSYNIYTLGNNITLDDFEFTFYF